METRVFAWDEVAQVGDAAADRRVIAGAAGDLKRVAVKAGYVAGRHAHDFEQFFMVLEGTGVLTTAAGDVALKPGVVCILRRMSGIVRCFMRIRCWWK